MPGTIINPFEESGLFDLQRVSSMNEIEKYAFEENIVEF